MSDNENNDQLNEYINELSSQSSIDISNNLNRECQQILSQQNLKLTSISNLELNHLALITIYFLYHQHLSDIAKELYNETFIRALQEEYNLLNNEKNDLIEHINSIQEKFQQIEDERLYSQEIIRKLNEKNYEQLEKQYNDLINENQLLKDYNALIYHDKLQEKIEHDSIEIKSLHDVDIQCDLNDEIQLSNTKESNLNNNLNEDSTIQQISNKQEIIRLKTIIEEIEIENKYLKDLNLKLYNSINNQSHDTDTQSSLRLTSIDNSVRTDIDNQQHDRIQTVEQIEENDWNDQISSLEFPLEESNITQENFIKQMIDNETQTDDQKHDKLIQVNNKLKRALQTIKEKIHHIVVERPELFRDSTDDTIERLDHLISAIGHQAAQIDHLKSEPFIPPSILSEQEIKQLIDERNQLQEDKSNNNQEIHNLKCQLTKYNQQIQSSSQINQLINNETQTDDQQHDKLIQVNNKLKRALQTIKEKIHQVVIARPELFQDSTDDTIERLNHLISTIEHQTAQINSLQTEYDDKQNEINELQSSLESYRYQIQNNLSEKDQEKSLLQERLNEIELQLKKTLNDHSLTIIKFELLSRERDVLIEQQTLQSIEHQQEIEQLQDELIQLKQTYIPLNEEIELLKEIIEQHSEKLTDLNEKNLILDAQKKEIEQQTNELENLRKEHTKLIELISIEKIDNQTQTDDRQHEKLLQINNKLKRIIQTFKEKIHRLVIEKPNLFDGISEETNERLDHLISIVENQTIQINLIQNQRDELEKQLRNEIKELERSLETSENELNYEKQVRSAQLVSAAPSEDISSSIVEDYQKQIDELEQKLSENNEEQSLLREHLNKVEVELKETKHNHELTLTKYKEEFLSLVEERNELIEQQTLSLIEHQREIEQLKKDNDQIREKSTEYKHVEIQTDEDIKALYEIIKQQSEELSILNEKNSNLLSQDELNREKKIDNETQTDDRQREKLLQMNNKLKRALQVIKDKIHRIVNEKPDLFNGIGEETNERLDHLISIVENQTTQIDFIQTEHQQQIKELQNSLLTCQFELDNERQQHVLAASSTEDISPSIIEDYQIKIEQLEKTLIEKENEQILLHERLNEIELELRKILDDQNSTLMKYELLVQERDLLIEQQTLHSTESQREIEQLKKELLELKQSPDYQHIETQTDDRQHEKLLQINNKLKRIIQTFKEKIHRLVIEKPNLFDGISEETNERLDHLISIVENQTIQINLIQNQRDELEKQLRNEIKELERSLETSENELNYEKQVRSAQLVSAAPSEDISSSIVEDYQKQIDELEQKLSENNEEQSLLREHLNKVEVELKETKHNHELTLTKYKEEFLSLVEERNELIEQQTLSSTEHQREIEQLKKDNDQIQEELTKLKQLPDYQHVEIQTHEDINALHELIEQQIEQIRILKEKCLSLANQIDSNIELQAEIERERKQIDEQINEYKNQIETLMRERTNLLEELEKKTLPTIQTTDNQCQTNDNEYKKLKRSLKIFKNKMNRIVNDRPDLFDGIGEETNERLDHLISTVKNQIIQINTLQAEHNLVEGQLRNEIKELQNCLEAYQHQIENERLTKTEQIVSTSSPVPSSEETSSTLIEDYQKKIDQLQESLLQKDAEQVLLQERFNKDELELKQTLMTKYESLLHEQNELIQQQTLRLMENQHEIEQLIALKRSDDCQHVESQTDEDINALQEKLNDLNEKNLTLLSQIESQDELKKQQKEIEEQLNEHKNQIENLINERQKLLEEIETNISPPIQSIDNEVQTIDDEHEKLLQINNTLKHTIETINDKINHIVTARPDLFKNISEEPIDHLDSLISIIENQTSEIIKLQSEYDQAEDKYQCEINDLESYSIIEHEHISTQEPQVCQTSESDDNEYNTWFDATPDIIDKNEIEQQQFHDIDTQCELITSTLSEQLTNDLNTPLYSLESSFIESQLLNNNSTQTEIDTEIQQIKNKIQQIILEYLIITSISNENIFENLDQIMSFIKNLQNEIKEIQSSFETYRNQIENERLTKMEELKSHQPPNDVCTQTLGLSIIEEHQKKIEKLQENELVYQHEIERLIEERDQAQNLLLQWKEDEAEKINDYETSYELKIREQDEKLAELYEQLQQQQDNNLSLSLNSVSSQTSFDVDSPIDSQISEYQSQIDNLLRERIILMEQIKEITCQPSKTDADTQTVKDIESLPSSDETISRHTFEQEMLAWSKESEQLKCFVKQIQIENKKLKDIILKFERMILDYMHENERLKQENQHLTFINYSKIQNINEKQNFINSDEDICYLTLKYLTYEVAQRISNNNNEQSIILTNESEPNLKQQLNDNKRQLKNVRLQNERLKGQLDSCTIHFKHVQNEMGTQIQEMSTIKDETERLRTNEIQYRLEIDRLRTELHDDQIKIQELERELANMKFKQSNIDNSSIDNLRELLELKERELNALKEKLDYTKQAHQIELQEAIKSSQFSLNNVKRFEQMDSRHQEKRRQLETTLGKFRSIVKPLIDNQQLFTENSIININELKKLVAEVDTEEKLNNSLSPIRDCLSLLEAQMKDLHHNIIENHARRSKRWKYKLGFECLSCESRWEVTHDIRDLQEACLDPSRFIESSIVEPMAGCSCPIMIDFAESDIRLCLDDILNEVIIQATVT
ncbi:unnamed protein product [Rotaria sordida]|uniref:Uncharacterized protein n=1 Tax=Rotaria sordida TaxID=392033 RepID=A0A818UE79_9BILA|nr:unnamed protein product [Rotaria sordida]